MGRGWQAPAWTFPPTLTSMSNYTDTPLALAPGQTAFWHATPATLKAIIGHIETQAGDPRLVQAVEGNRIVCDSTVWTGYYDGTVHTVPAGTIVTTCVQN